MYRGKRDSMLGIIVRQDQCELYIDNNGNEWVEIFIPNRDINPVGWAGSIMVEPEHVNFVDDIYNEFFVNSGADIKIIQKYLTPDGRRIMGEVQIEKSELILARQLQYETFCNGHIVEGPVEYVYFDFINSGLKMMNYIKRYC